MSRKGPMHCSTLVGRWRHCPNSRLKYPVKEPLIKLMLHTIRMEQPALPPVIRLIFLILTGNHFIFFQFLTLVVLPAGKQI